MNNKIAIFSDLHLGVHQNSSYWFDIGMKWVKWFRSELDKQNITQVIFCGDFFHYRDEVSVIALNAADKFLDVLDGIEIYMITGNHDCYYKEVSTVNSLSIIRGRKNIKVFDELTVKQFGNKNFVFCPWGTKLHDIPQCDVVFGHFELQNFNMNTFKICENGDDVEDVINKSNLIFSGHFHMMDVKTFDKSTVIYVGNPFEMDFNDRQQRKGFYTLDTDTLSYKFIENNITPNHVSFNLSKLIASTNPDKVFDKWLPNNIVKLVVDKNISTDHLDILVSKITSYKPEDLIIDYDVNYNKIKIESSNDHDIMAVSIESAIEEFVNMLDIQNKKEVIAYTIDLLHKSKI